MKSESNKILIPKSSRKKALVIVDVESKFLKGNTKKAIPNIQKIIKRKGYDLFVVAEYTNKTTSLSALEKSKWLKKYGKINPDEETIPEITNLLAKKKVLEVIKTTRSVFGNTDAIYSCLEKKKIKEVHIVGFETNDCVHATALDAFDFGFVTIVVEEACASKSLAHHKSAIALLHKLNLTNHSLDL